MAVESGEKLPAYIESIRVLSGEDEPAARDLCDTANGYILIEKNLNEGSGGRFIYLSCRLTPDGTKALTDIRTTRNDAQMAPPYTKTDVDLNGDACLVKALGVKIRQRIFLWTSRDAGSGRPIRDIGVLFPGDGLPEHFEYVTREYSGIPENVNAPMKGHPVYIVFQRSV
jgi:hypothetical protein